MHIILWRAPSLVSVTAVTAVPAVTFFIHTWIGLLRIVFFSLGGDPHHSFSSCYCNCVYIIIRVSTKGTSPLLLDNNT